MIPVRHVGRAVLVVWALVCTLGAGALLAFHLLSLPVPPIDDPVLTQALAANQTVDERGHWRVVHVLYARCPCSKQILSSLIEAGPAEVAERVVLVDDSTDLTARLITAGFRVDRLTHAELGARWHIEAAPLLLVADDAGRVRYAGGYTERKQGPILDTHALVAALRRGAPRSTLPLFGCATSQELQSLIDPLHIKRVMQWLSPG